jgi:hypothetical protein
MGDRDTLPAIRTSYARSVSKKDVARYAWTGGLTTR